MPRQPSVRYFDSRHAYYCQFRGKQHLLASGPDDFPDGPAYQQALRAFQQLMALGSIETAKDNNTVRVLCEKYMQHAEGRLKHSTMSRRKYLLGPFVDNLGEEAVGRLTHFQVEGFIAKQRQPRHVGKFTYRWREGTVASFLESAQAVFNWGVKKKLITANPLKGFEGPSARSRSRDCLVTPQEHQKVLDACRSTAMRKLIIALENTGARPGELISATAKDWHDQTGTITFYCDDRRREDEFRHKSARHKDRSIFFTGEALEMAREIVRERPTGVIFPSSRGRPYSHKSISSCFKALRSRVGMPKLTAYSYRHTFATNWLLAGKSIELLAEIMGNSPPTIRKHYAHLCSDKGAIRKQLEEFMKREQVGSI